MSSQDKGLIFHLLLHILERENLFKIGHINSDVQSNCYVWMRFKREHIGDIK